MKVACFIKRRINLGSWGGKGKRHLSEEGMDGLMPRIFSLNPTIELRVTPSLGHFLKRGFHSPSVLHGNG